MEVWGETRGVDMCRVAITVGIWREKITGLPENKGLIRNWRLEIFFNWSDFLLERCSIIGEKQWSTVDVGS